ncbi:hypothetical protein R3P38DRAFT_2813835, partial [Favolaschia claudopus]
MDRAATPPTLLQPPLKCPPLRPLLRSTLLPSLPARHPPRMPPWKDRPTESPVSVMKRALTYDVECTSTISGLPPVQKGRLVHGWRCRHLEQEHPERASVNDDADDEVHARAQMSYDISCYCLKNAYDEALFQAEQRAREWDYHPDDRRWVVADEAIAKALDKDCVEDARDGKACAIRAMTSCADKTYFGFVPASLLAAAAADDDDEEDGRERMQDVQYQGKSAASTNAEDDKGAASAAGDADAPAPAPKACGRSCWKPLERIDSFVDFEAHVGDTTRDTEFELSQDGRRGNRVAFNVQAKRRRLHPSELQDAFGEWVPLREDENRSASDADAETDEGEAEGEVGEKRKRYDSSRLWGRRRLPCDAKIAGISSSARRAFQRWTGEVLVEDIACCAGMASTSWATVDGAAPVQLRNCGICRSCDLRDTGNIEDFRSLSVIGNLTVLDFIKTMERSTDAAGLHSVPRLMRAGRGHDDAWGEWHKGRRVCRPVLGMPARWHESPRRLAGCGRRISRDDPPLGSGWGYLVEEKEYHEHLRGYVGEEDARNTNNAEADQYLRGFSGPAAEGHPSNDRLAVLRRRGR